MIRDGAVLVENPEEILDFYADLYQAHQNVPVVEEIETCSSINELGLTTEPTSIEMLMERTGDEYAVLTKKLNIGILEGRVVRFPGECYALLDKEVQS